MINLENLSEELQVYISVLSYTDKDTLLKVNRLFEAGFKEREILKACNIASEINSTEVFKLIKIIDILDVENLRKSISGKIRIVGVEYEGRDSDEPPYLEVKIGDESIYVINFRNYYYTTINRTMRDSSSYQLDTSVSKKLSLETIVSTSLKNVSVVKEKFDNKELELCNQWMKFTKEYYHIR